MHFSRTLNKTPKLALYRIFVAVAATRGVAAGKTCFFALHGYWTELCTRFLSGCFFFFQTNSTGVRSPLGLCSSSEKLTNIATAISPTQTTETWCFNPRVAPSDLPAQSRLLDPFYFFFFFYLCLKHKVQLEEPETVALFLFTLSESRLCDGADCLDRNLTHLSALSSYSWKRHAELIQSLQAFSSKA